MTEVDAAIDRLTDRRHARSAREFQQGQGSDQPGLYTWWTDETGRAQLSRGLGHEVGSLIYGGQAGATRWPSGTTSDATIRSRIVSNHLGSSIRSSTFRRTLSALLVETIPLTAVAQKKLAPASELALTEWMLEHLSVSTYEYVDRDGLGTFEDDVLARIDPPLNLQGVATNPARLRLKELRSALGQGTSPPPPTTDHHPQVRSRSITLHEELLAILEDQGGSWMTTKELATAVQKRGRYEKRDGTSDVTAYQVHGRTRKYPHLFERDGTRVRSRAGEDL